MSPISTGGGYRFGFQAASISPASLKRSSLQNFQKEILQPGKKIFLQSKNFLLNRCVIKPGVIKPRDLFLGNDFNLWFSVLRLKMN
jgi:hypothetical protein